MRPSRQLAALMALIIAAWPVVDASPRAKAPSRIHQQSADRQQQDEETPEQKDKLNQSVGTVHWSDADLGLAVVQVHTSVNPFDSRLIARDFDLNPTAILQPTTIRRNKILGVIIISGTVSAGDEVIIPGVAYREALGALLKSE